MQAIADLRGKPFGKLTALYPTEKRTAKKEVVWMCSCSCGIQDVEASSSDLVAGEVTSCGCTNSSRWREIVNRPNHWAEHFNKGVIEKECIECFNPFQTLYPNKKKCDKCALKKMSRKPSKDDW